EECALIDGASRYQILTKIVLPLAVPGLISAFIFCFTLCWNEFIYALTFISSTQNKTVPVAIVNEFVDGDIYRWGSLMAVGAGGSALRVSPSPALVADHLFTATGAVSAWSRLPCRGLVLKKVGARAPGGTWNPYEAG